MKIKVSKLRALVSKAVNEARAMRGPRQQIDLAAAKEIVASYAAGDPLATRKFEALYKVLARAGAEPQLMAQYAADAADMYNAGDDDFDEEGDSNIGSAEPEEYEEMALAELETIWAWMGKPFIELV
jgi:hypothetical protein